MKQYYCLLAFSRTGSTALEQVLSKHYDIFHDKTRLPTIADKRRWVLEFPERCNSIQKSICGFKCLLYHYDEYIQNDILENIKFKKIILLRKNIFQAAISKKVAEKIGNWHIKIDYNTIQPFEISKDWLFNYLNFVNKNINLWKSKSKNYEIFYYEDIFFNKEKYKPILDFLNIKEPILNYDIEKSNNYDTISNIVSNYKELENIYEKFK